MKLFLLRHADAEDEAESDAQRPLSAKGEEQSRRVAALCRSCGQLPEVILHSPLLRTRQTAALYAKHIGLPRLIEVGWLACGMRPSTAFDELRAYAEFSALMLVGHEPDLSQLAASLLGMRDPSALHLRKASLTCLTLSGLSAGAGCLEYLVPAKLLKP